MKIVNIDPYAVHDQVALLLPWYVNKSLKNKELQLVESHIAICLTCKREVLLLEKLAQEIKQSAAVDALAQQGFKQFKNRLQSSQTSAAHSQAALVGRLSVPQTKARTLSVFSRSAMALAAMLLLSFLLPSFIGSEKYGENAYRTLATDKQAKASWNDIHVVFAEQTSTETIRRLLANVSAEIIGQANEQSVYTVRPKKVESKDQLQRVLVQLRQEPQIIFAETAETNLASPSAVEGELK